MHIDGPRIRRKRETNGCGLRRFAAVAQVSPAHLSRIERGLSGAQPEVAARIADALGCRVEDIEPKRTEEST